MGENEREIEVEVEVEVRSLTGESTTVFIPANKSIGDLKLVLKQSFPPASISPSFHLFFKGVKLSLQSHISDYSINPGEFMAFIPFTRKNYQQLTQHNESATPLEAHNQCSASKLADSAWSDMMQDLSALRDISRDETQQNTEVCGMNIEDRNEESGRKCVSHSSVTKRNKKANDHGQEGLLDDLLIGILQSSVIGGNIFDEQNCEKFIKVLERVNCLSGPHSGNCMLNEANLSNSSLCSCPSWLKTLMKAFCLLNIYSSFLQLQNKKVTLNGLKEVLDQVVKFGLRVGLADFEHLSLLCPKAVHFVNNEMEKTKLRNALVIVRSLMEQRDLVENKPARARTSFPIPKVISGMKKREESFKKHLRLSIEHFLFKNEDRMTKFFSLEDLLISVMESGGSVRGNEAKGKKRGHSGAASSHSFEARCCETNPLLPAEMIDHLRMGIGSQGQIVHIEEISARNANYVDIPHEFSESTKSALRYLGVTRLYSHQAESIQSSLTGNNVVVATMTSSGKSLCYNLPVLETLSQNLLSCALYLFPTK